MNACSRIKFFTCLMLPALLTLAPAHAQQSNVNLDWRPHLNTEHLTPFSAPSNSPEVFNDHTVIFRLKAPEAKKSKSARCTHFGSTRQGTRTGAF